jgi:hypothetical protein
MIGTNDTLAREIADAKACLALAVKDNLPMEYVEYWRQRLTDLQGS